MATETKKIINRRDTAARWASTNPILASGEIGIDTTNRVMKVGDGKTAWNDLKSERELIFLDNLVEETGTSTVKVMSQRATTDAIRKSMYSDVMLRSVRSSGGAQEKLSESLLDVKLDGMPDGRRLIVSKFSLVNYEGNYLSIRISDVTDGKVETVMSFSQRFPEMRGIVAMLPSSISSADVYNASVTVDLDKVGATYFSGYDITEWSEDLYSQYGIKPKQYVGLPPTAAVGASIPGRVKAAISKMCVANLDLTRNYVLKTFAFDKNASMLTISLCTDENVAVVYQLQAIVETTVGNTRVYSKDREMYADVDMGILNSKFGYSFNNSTLDHSGYGINVDSFADDVTLHAEEELSLTLGGIPMKLLDCGKLSGYFYLGWKNTIFMAESIVKEHYSASDIGRDLIPVCSFDSIAQISSKKFIEGINSARELNSGDLLINVNVNSYSTEEKTEFASYSIFYRYDGSDLHNLFDGSWGYKTLTSGTVQTGGFMTNVWDFDQHDDLVFVSERGTQGQQGRVWMSKDGGVTWYVIFNAFTHTNYDLYKIVQPSGWDNTNSSKPDFQRPISNTPTYPNGSFFHIHGVSYDKWRDQVIVVSGDATWAKGSYSAIWVLKNPRSCEVYPASGDIPEGGTLSDKAPKMLKCDWKRVGLYNDENSIGKNLQFVMSLPFKDVISFGTDCGGGGINGIINNTYPANIVGSNLRVAYALNPDSENLLTHCASGALRLKNEPVLWVHHREGTGFSSPNRVSEQKAAILSSYDGKTWKRVWEDDTLDAELNSKVSWGATIIGKKDELYLRYKGFATTDNEIRRIVVR